VYNEATNAIYIITGVGTYKQLNTNREDTGMTQAEIKEWLKNNGIHLTDDGSEALRIDNLADITFIHEETGKQFKFFSDANGELKSQELLSTSLEKRMKDANFVITGDDPTNLRGLVGCFRYAELKKEKPDTPIVSTSDFGQYSDRVKIAAIYAPKNGQDAFGCSHAFIELENNSDKDFHLDGCYLHIA